MRKLLIIDEQAQYVQYLRAHLGDLCEIIFQHPKDGLAEYIAQIKPDHLILDFTSSRFEGFTVLRSAISLGANPAVIGIGQSSYYFKAMVEREKNISSTLSHPINPQTIANMLSLMMELPMEQLVPLPTRRQFTAFMLSSLDIHIDWLGGQNLLDLIPLAADSSESFYIKHLYLEAAKRSGSTAQNVERNVRTAIGRGFKQGNRKTWEGYFRMSHTGPLQKPSNLDFISILAMILNTKKDQYRDDE